ncbi:MAG: hypothetical protein WC254_00800 [Candidatus Woesearchaeota archaeon]|jgi:hypothetical protein
MKTTTGLAAIIATVFSTTAEAAISGKVEAFPNTAGVMNETKLVGTNILGDKFPIGYLARNRLLIGYDKTPTELLLQILSIGNYHGFQIEGQWLLKNNEMIPRAGIGYNATFLDSSLTLSSSLITSIADDLQGEFRITTAYTTEKRQYGQFKVDAEQHVWFTDESLTGTTKLYLGYKRESVVTGVATELDTGIDTQLAVRPGVFFRIEMK